MRDDQAVKQMDEWLRVLVLGSWRERRKLRRELRRHIEVRNVAFGGYPG